MTRGLRELRLGSIIPLDGVQGERSVRLLGVTEASGDPLKHPHPPPPPYPLRPLLHMLKHHLPDRHLINFHYPSKAPVPIPPNHPICRHHHRRRHVLILKIRSFRARHPSNICSTDLEMFGLLTRDPGHGDPSVMGSRGCVSDGIEEDL